MTLGSSRLCGTDRPASDGTRDLARARWRLPKPQFAIAGTRPRGTGRVAWAGQPIRGAGDSFAEPVLQRHESGKISNVGSQSMKRGRCSSSPASGPHGRKRKAKENPDDHQLFAFLNDRAVCRIAPIRKKAMPVI